MKNHHGSRRTRVLLTTALLFALGSLSAAGAFAAERVVESLGGAKKFAPLWPGGTFEMGGDAGFPWARIVTDGKAGPSFIANVRPYNPTLDATGRFVKVWIKIDDVTRMGGMEFRLSSDRFNSNYFAFEFPMYDDADFNVVRDGVWTTLTFPFGSARVEGKPDRKAINSVGWYVADKGEEAPVTAFWGGVALVDEPPEGVVSITFDDGYDDHYLAAQIMHEHGFQGTAYIIPDAIGQHGYMNLHQLVDLQERYGWDVAAHHETPFTQMRPDELESTILGVQRYLTENEFGGGAKHLAYPLGKQNTSLVRPLVRKHFATARVAGSGPETLPPADPHLLRVMNVLDTTTPEEIGAAARMARENKQWLILMFHYLVDEPTNPIEYSTESFKKAMAQLAAAQVRVLPLARVWEACNTSTLGLENPCRLGGAVAKPAE